jgi:hypothetical protein
MLPSFLANFVPAVVDLGKNLITVVTSIGEILLKFAQGLFFFVQGIPIIGPLIKAAMDKSGISGAFGAVTDAIDSAKGLVKGMQAGDFNGNVDRMAIKLQRELEALKGLSEDSGKLELLKEEDKTLKEVATNTRALVELQEKAVELNRQLLGGGQLAKFATSPYNMTQTGAYAAGGWEAQVIQGIKAAVIQQALSSRVARA